MSKPSTAFAVVIALALASVSQAALISGVTIQDVSSELTSDYNRAAIYTITAPGLNIHGPNTYSTVPDGNMWLDSGNGCCGGVSNIGPGDTDPHPQITWNLGGIYDVANMRIWNYNEGPAAARGIQTTDVLVSLNGISYTNLGSITLHEAPGSDMVDFSQVVNLNVNAHYVRFANMTSWGGDNNFIGLSAIQFSGTPSPEPGSFVLCGLGAIGLFVAARRRRKA